MATTQPPKKRRLPNGHDEAAYNGYEKWSLDRWAWEFLRRNEGFIKACHEPVKTPGQQLKTRTHIVRQFHLKRFKHCNESYHVGDRPLFDLIGIMRCKEDQSGLGYEISIRQAEVLVRFNLEFALQSSNALPAQLLMAEKMLKEHVRMLARIRNTRLPNNKPKFGTVADRIRWLRMLDAARHARSPKAQSGDEPWSQPDIYRNLFPIEANGLDRDQLRARFKNAFRTAEKCTQRTYLEMVIAGQKERASQKIAINDASAQ